MIYLNVTNTCLSKARTGIQRVVRELGMRLTRGDGFELIVFRDSAIYRIEQPQEMQQFLDGKDFQPRRELALQDIGPGDVFFDMDASWHDGYDADAIWRQLKKQGCLLVKLHYDALPVLAPEYVNPTTVFRYVENFSSSLALFDHWICISKAVERDLHRIAQTLDCGRPFSHVFELGADILVPADGHEHPGGRCGRLIRERYLLTVGTVEPRKNHELVLDAYEALIEDGSFADTQLVIVGKLGWSNDLVVKRIREHPEFNRRIHWLDDASDAELDQLYRHAQLCLCLSHYEGFGLPVVEALAHGVPVICTADSVMEEVAKGRAMGVALERDEVVAAIKQTLLAGRPDQADPYVPVSWDESALQLRRILSAIQASQGLDTELRQAVYISIRPESLRRSILSVQEHMRFIDEVVVLTSDACFDDMRRALAPIGLRLRLLRESEIGIDALPADHQERNTTLRRKLYQSDAIDQNFIAFDDDYLVIRPVERTAFVEDGVHKACFFYQDGAKWLGAAPAPTSFDIGIWKTVAYLSRAVYDTRLYNSHQPQVIHRPLAVEILNRTAGLGLDEWSTYFNIAKHLKPGRFVDVLYMAAGWPEYFNGWLPCAAPRDVVYYNAAPVRKDLGRQAERWREELVQALKDSSRVDDVRLEVKEDAVAFAQDVIEIPLGVKVFIPILSSTHVEYLSCEFLDHRMEFEGGNTPNFIATFKIVQKRDFRIDVVVQARDSERMTASLEVRVDRS